MMEQMQQWEQEEDFPVNDWEDISDQTVVAWLKEACTTREKGHYIPLRALEVGRRLMSLASEEQIITRLDRAYERGIIDRGHDGDIALYCPKV